MAEATYALSATHKEVCLLPPMVAVIRENSIGLTWSIFTQMLEKSLLDSDPEVAEIMVSSYIHTSMAT